VSHILSGRNKPSLDFILKVLTSYPEIDADWLLFGKGQMINLESKTEPASKPAEEKAPKKPALPDLFAQALPGLETPIQTVEADPAATPPVAAPVSEKVIETIQKEIPERIDMIEKIVVFYADNTFKEYRPK
jgi:hypothetical protein